MGGPSLAAVLFTDLVGSTAQRSELGEEAGEELRRTHDRLLSEAVEAHGGRVVKSTGDGIMATFPGAAEAVAGGVAIQQAIDRHNRRADAVAPLSVRTGLSAGDVTWEDDDAFGTPAIEAARLCAQAEGGQILAADVVRVLAGARERDRFSAVGDLDLKGLPGPMTAWEIGWQPDTEPVVPMPGGLAPVGGFSFVGRSTELELLDDAWQAAVEGQRRVVWVSGEPGIGKTRLISEFAHQAAAQGGVVLYGRAESELGVPYKAIVEALTGYVRACADQDLAAQVGPLSGELIRLVPQLVERVPDLADPLQAEPETQRYRLFEAIAELLTAASTTWPLVLVLDDLQWAGKPTILLLGHLMASDPNMRVLVVGGYRDTEVGVDHPLTGLLAETHRVGGIGTLSLGGLGEAEVADLTREATGSEPGGLARQVLGATDGNPFFVSEILRAVTSTSPTGEVDLVSLGVPDGAQAMVTARLHQLDPDRRPVLETAAVIGQRFDLPLLCAVVDDDELVLAALADAEAAGLVGTHELLGGRQFAHALIRDALYHSLTPTARIARHRRVATALEALPGGDRRLGELAHHATQAIDLLGVDTAVDYTRRAGDQARHDLAFEEAATHYQTALDLLDDTDPANRARQCDLLVALGDAYQRAGDARDRDVLLRAADIARALADDSRLVAAALTLVQYPSRMVVGLIDEDIIGTAREALTAVPNADPTLRARLLAGLAGALQYSPDKAEQQILYSEAVEAAHRVDDPVTLAEVYRCALDADPGPDSTSKRVDIASELLQLGESLDAPEYVLWGAFTKFLALFELAEIEVAIAALDAADEIAHNLHQPLFEWMVLIGRTLQATLRGRLDDAESLALQCAERGEAAALHPSRVAAYYGLQIFQIRDDQGRLSELEDLMAGLVASQPAISPGWSVALALIHAETGNILEAQTAFEELAVDRFSVLPKDGAWLKLIDGLARVAAVIPEPTGAEDLLEQLQPYAGRANHVNGGMLGLVDLSLAQLNTVLGRFDSAEHSFTRAAVYCTEVPAPTLLTRTRLQWAKMLTRRNGPKNRTRAIALAHEALTAAEQIGMNGVARNARDLLTEIET